MKLRAFDFFCGAGGLTRGLLDAGIDVVAGIDVDDRCRETYVANNPGVSFLTSDIREIDVAHLKRIIKQKDFSDTLFAGCAPCQPFSRQRKSPNPHKDKTALGLFGELVSQALPSFVLVENVPGIAKVKGYSTFKRFVGTLEACGYEIAYKVLDAKDFGVPQTRKRMVLIAAHRTKVSLPDPTHGGKRQPYVTVRDTIAHFPRLKAGYVDPETPNHNSAALTEINLERLRHTPPNGGDRRSWPKHLVLKCHTNVDTGGFTDTYGRMYWDRPAPTLTGKCHSISNGRYGHPSQNRAISLREAAALQSFPDWYEFFGNNGDVALQIGNAVPVRLATVLGQHILGMWKSLHPKKNKK